MRNLLLLGVPLLVLAGDAFATPLKERTFLAGASAQVFQQGSLLYYDYFQVTATYSPNTKTVTVEKFWGNQTIQQANCCLLSEQSYENADFKTTETYTNVSPKTWNEDYANNTYLSWQPDGFGTYQPGEELDGYTGTTSVSALTTTETTKKKTDKQQNTKATGAKKNGSKTADNAKSKTRESKGNKSGEGNKGGKNK